MTYKQLWLVCLRVCLAGVLALGSQVFGAGRTVISFERTQRTSAVSFQKEVLPILQANCLPCHNQTRSKASLNLETPALMLKGGETGPALVSGNPATSLLLKTSAHEVEDLVMPPKDNKVNARELTPGELTVLWSWIAQGAKTDSLSVVAPLWKAIPTNWQSSFAVAVTHDGKTAAVGRANRVILQDIQSGIELGQLTDPSLQGAAQRDVVGALAFSPDDETLAAAGFREVRLWRRQPVSVRSVWSLPAGPQWVAAEWAPKLDRFALITSEGRLEVRSVTNGLRLADWTLPGGLASGRNLLSWSSNGQSLAATAGTGAVYVVHFGASFTNSSRNQNLTVGAGVRALTWYGADSALAVAAGDTAGIQRFHRVKGVSEATSLAELERMPVLEGGKGQITALTSEAGPVGLLISGSSEGLIKLWPAELKAAPQQVAVTGAVVRLGRLGSGKSFIATLATGGTAEVRFGEKPMMEGRFGQTPLLALRQGRLDDELALSRVEQKRALKQITDAEAAKKAADEALVKMSEKRAGHVKALAGQEQDLKKETETEATTVRDRDLATADLERITGASRTAETVLKEGSATAKLVTETDAATRTRLALADQLKSELERLLAGQPTNGLASSLVPLRAATAAAVLESQTLRKKSDENRTAAAKALEDLATKAYDAGRKKTEADRAQAELPPRKKQAEEKLVATQKAVAALKKQIEKSRITLEGSTQDVTLAEKTVSRVVESMALARVDAAAAVGRIDRSLAASKELGLERERAALKIPSMVVGSPEGTALLVLGADGLGACWEPGSGRIGISVDLGSTASLAVASLGGREFFELRSGELFRLDASRSWKLSLTLGGAETSSVPGAFVDRVNALAFSPDGQHLATGGGDPSRSGELKIWNCSNGTLVRDFGMLHSDCVTAVAFSPRGDRLFSGGTDRFGRITPVKGDGPRINLEGHSHHLLGVAWAADGGVVASASADGTVKFWNPVTGERTKNVDGFGKEVTGLQSVGVSGEFVAMSGDGRGRIMRGNGEKIRDLAAVPDYLQALAVSSDGFWAVGADDHGLVSVWELATGEKRKKNTTR